MVVKRCWTIIVIALALVLPSGSLSAPPVRFANAGQSPPDGLTPLRELLKPNGTLDLSTGFSGALDPVGWRMAYDANGGPVFVQAREPAAPLAPANTWNALGSGLADDVCAIAVAGADVYVGGDFLNAGGNAHADYVAR